MVKSASFKTESKDGSIYWFDTEGRRHNEDGPAYITTNLSVWYYYGMRHNVTGPAMIYKDGRYRWFINSNEYSYKGWINHPNTSDENLAELLLEYS